MASPKRFTFEKCGFPPPPVMPYLINPETRLTLKATEAGLPGTDEDYVIWDPASNAPVVVTYPFNEGVAAPLFGTFEVNGMQCPTGGQLSSR